MKKWILAALLLVAATHAGLAQRYLEGLDEPKFSDRVYFGGGGNLQFGNNFFLVGVSPLMGYMMTERLSSGVRLTYQYLNFRMYDQSTHTYGAGLFTRYNISRSIFAMAEYESLNMERYPGAEMPRSWNERMLLGGGYYQQFGERGGSMMGIFYDVFYRYGSSPFPSPWVMRFGFTF